jgi:HEAT repeat protein
MANLRRENRLPEGVEDPSYPPSRQSPQYYAMVAGPQRLQDVLDRALRDNDSDLALDAIAGLSATASLEALQPLTRALAFPDRRVRFRAAEALARAMPTESFNNDYRVVPVLAEGVRQTETPTALIVAESQEDRNQLLAAISDQGFRTLDAPTVEDAAGLINQAPGVELIVVRGSQTAVRQAVEASSGNYKLAVAPILAVVDSSIQASLDANYESEPRVTVVAGDTADLASAVDLAETNFGSMALETQEAAAFAVTALSLLERIAEAQSVYEVTDALPSLIEAATDPRPAVATAAGDVLSRINDPNAQTAIAAAALAGSGQTQIDQLIDLAESANAWGNLIPDGMGDDLLDLVKSSTGETANAAAQAHGALSLPTRNAVELIVQP